MKALFIAVCLLGLTIAGSAVLRRDHGGEPWRAGLSSSGFAVLELFTSEGCSSCPPADALIAKMQQEDKDLPVYIMAFHVDYWDRLGWKDAYSNSAYTSRQQQYATWLKLQTIYTPQVVINGVKECVGSQADEVYGTVKSVLQQPGDAQLLLSGLQLKNGHLDWTCKAEGHSAASNKLSLVIAIVERSAVSQVKAGENKGKTLSHVQIVRALRMSSLDDKQTGAGQLDWPADMSPADGEVIALLQNQDSGQIVAAARGAVVN